MLSFLMFTILLVATVSADVNSTACPTSCKCRMSVTGSRLAIRCHQNISDADLLSQEIDSLLSIDHIAKSLTGLSIHDTPLTQVPASVCQLLSLTELYLDRNNLTGLPDRCLSKLTNLIRFEATENAIVRLQDGLFDGLENLDTLNLERNHISEVGLHVFSNASGLISLRYLLLCCNRLTSLDPWWYYRAIASNGASPAYIMLHGNFISNFTNKFGFDFHCGMQAPFGYLDLTDNRVVHVSDAFQAWNINSMQEYLCLRNFGESLNPHMHIYVGMHGYSTFACDCTDFWLYERVKTVPLDSILNGVRCNSTNGSNQTVDAVSIPLNQFVCNVTYRCPRSCRCVYRPANTTLHVYCSSTNLSSLPRHVPPLPNTHAGYHLDFSRNELTQILQYRAYFANTTVLDLSDAGIGLQEIDERTWNALARMKRVYLQGNKIQSVPRVVLASGYSANGSLHLGNNPWDCSCDNRDLSGWFKSVRDRLSDPKSVQCETPARLHGKNILEISGDDFCTDPVRQMRITVGTLGSLSTIIVIVISVSLAAYRLRVRVYRRFNFHPFDRDECTGEDMDYDVFMCFSSEDNNPHGLHILELLESKGYRVRYHLRDFLAGAPIGDSMCQAIVHSKRTLCLLSKHFLRSSYCMTEFDMAFHHNVAMKRKKRLIIVTMLDSPNDINAHDVSCSDDDDMAALRHHVRQYTYIDYTADDWLDKLLYALPLSGLLQHAQNTSDDIHLVHRTP